MEVYFLQPFLDIEARTALANPGEVMMTQNLGIGIVEGETVEEVFQRILLGWSASVGRLAFLVETTLVADSDAVGVVVTGVSPHLGFWTAGIDHAILRNVIVVTDGVETTGLVAGFQGFYREVLVNTCGTAMYHNQIDFSLILHGCVVVRLIMIFFRGSEAFVLEVGATLHTEGAENGSEDSDDEIDDGFPVYFHDVKC